jgi:sulfatase modifying factor 1
LWAVFLFAVVLVALFWLLALGFGWSWTGFGEYETTTTTSTTTTPSGTVTETIETHPAKTLWDWLTFLLASTVAAMAAMWVHRRNQRRDSVEAEREENNRRETSLQTYYDRISELITDKGLLEEEKDEVRSIARARTLAKVRRERSAEPLLRAAADTDAEVVGSALQALMELGETVRPVVAKSLAGTDKRLWKGSIRYLATRLDDPLCGKVPEQAWEVVTGLPMVWVPPGPFTMGSGNDDPDADDCEKPQRQVTLSGYWICRYPMTVGHYMAFVEYSGYGYEDVSGLFRVMPWRLRERWGLRYRFDDVIDWLDPPDRPVANVTWYDAIAYCRWLREQNGLPVTLPSEVEWEKAARGTDGRLYPWGDQLPTDELCSFDYNVGDKTPVGHYSTQGDSPYGCADMAGNVWEWTRSRYDEYPYGPTDGREDLGADGNVPRVLRGGSWLDPRSCTRCAARHWHPLR